MYKIFLKKRCLNKSGTKKLILKINIKLQKNNYWCIMRGTWGRRDRGRERGCRGEDRRWAAGGTEGAGGAGNSGRKMERLRLTGAV
jgi:hypothetical protein